jgi:hypothetical protein
MVCVTYGSPAHLLLTLQAEDRELRNMFSKSQQATAIPQHDFGYQRFQYEHARPPRKYNNVTAYSQAHNPRSISTPQGDDIHQQNHESITGSHDTPSSESVAQHARTHSYPLYQSGNTHTLSHNPGVRSMSSDPNSYRHYGPSSVRISSTGPPPASKLLGTTRRNILQELSAMALEDPSREQSFRQNDSHIHEPGLQYLNSPARPIGSPPRAKKTDFLDSS